MSIVDDRVRHIDTILDRIQIFKEDQHYNFNRSSTRRTQQDISGNYIEAPVEDADTQASPKDSARVLKLKSLIRSLSTTAGAHPLLKISRLKDVLLQVKSPDGVSATSTVETELEWLAVAKATIQIYGTLLNILLDQTIPLSESIWYWDDVLGSYAYTALYTLQSSLPRLWQSTRTIYSDARERYMSGIQWRAMMNARNPDPDRPRQTVAEGWREFYRLVQDSIEERTLAKKTILSPFAVCRTEARQKQDGSRKLRARGATAIGLLVERGIRFTDPETEETSALSWKEDVVHSIMLMERIFGDIGDLKLRSSGFATTVMEDVESRKAKSENAGIGSPQAQVDKLTFFIDNHIPSEQRIMNLYASDYGKPSRWVRYWAPGLLLLVSGGTLLRMLTNRRQEIIQWTRELGETTIDFWYNWVIEPVKRLVGTIRHDENSELAIMSKDSLRSDRESLERMVVDFAVQNPENGTPYTQDQIADIRAKVKEGDLSAVLKAYEKDIQSPAKGAIFGSLVHALLIQIQKTKVDVEVAMSGIDTILKSQELLFGMVGIAPGMVISWLAFRWLGSTFGNRRGLKQMQQQGNTVRLLRNIDRTLSKATLTEDGDRLSYKDHGLLLCEVQLLRQRGVTLVPGNVQREFIEDLNDLLDVSQGRDKQSKVVQRIQWAYGKWLK